LLFKKQLCIKIVDLNYYMLTMEAPTSRMLPLKYSKFQT
jgi:hypothetical protein